MPVNTIKTAVHILIVLPLFVFYFSSVAAVAFPFRVVQEGDPVPDVTLMPVEKKKPCLRFSGLKGKPFVAVFWGADLPEKIEHAAKILEGVEELAPFLQKRDVQVISVNAQNDEKAAIEKVLSRSGSRLDVYLDENLSAYSALGIFVMPSVLLVNSDGKIAAGMGYSRDLPDRLKGEIEIMLGEKTPEQVAAELRPEMKEVSAETKAGNRHYHFGMVMIKRGQFDSAIREFAKAVEINPDMSEAYLQLGCLYLEKNELEKAEEAIAKLLAVDPESVQGKICKGELLRLKNELDEAYALLQNVITVNPSNYKAHYYLGRVLEDREKKKEAMERYKTAYKAILMETAEIK